MGQYATTCKCTISFGGRQQAMRAAAEAARDAGEAASPAADAAPGLPDNAIPDNEQAPVAPTAAPTAAAAAAAAAPPTAEPTGSLQQARSGGPGASGSEGAHAASPAADQPQPLYPPVADYDAGSAVDTQAEWGPPQQPAIPSGSRGGSGSVAQPGRGFALGPVSVDPSQFMRLRYLVMMREEGSGRAVAVSLQGGQEAVLAFEVGHALLWSCCLISRYVC